MEVTRSAPLAHSADGPDTNRPSPVASWRHTLILLTIFSVLAVAGATRRSMSHTPSSTPTSHVGLYVSLILAEWALAYYVLQGVRRRGGSITALIGRPWSGPRAIVGNVALAAVLWGAWKVIGPLLPAVKGSVVPSITPHGATEVILWVMLSVSAGVVEELVFRGYFQRQFIAFFGSAAIGVLLQAVLFGVSHGYQGAAACLRITVYGAVFGVVALWRQDVRPGMIAHAWTDVAAGLLGL